MRRLRAVRLGPAALVAWLAVAAAGPAPAAAQALEVQQSSGTVEALLPDLGWRQAVVGRQLPSGSLLTAWIDSNAKFTYGDSVCTVGSLSHLRVVAVSDQLIQLSLAAGSITVETTRQPFEIAFRGVTVRVENGTVSLADGVLSVRSGSVVVSGARDAPLTLSAGSALDLLARREGPVFQP